MTEEQNQPKESFAQKLAILADNAQPFSTSRVSGLSNMGEAQQAQFERTWPGIETERRRRIVGTMNELVEDNIELDFSQALTFALRDADAIVRSRAIEGLWEDESRDLLQILTRLFENDPSHIVREKAALALARFAYLAEIKKLPERWYNRIRDALIGAIINPQEDIDVRRRAVEALGYFANDPQVAQLIGDAYKSDDDVMRASAIRAMGRNMSDVWMPVVRRELDNDEPALRYEAAYAAGEMGKDEFIQRLAAMVEDDDPQVRLEAIWALGQIGGPEAQRTLRLLSQEGDEASRDAAKEALEEVRYADDPFDVVSGRPRIYETGDDETGDNENDDETDA